MPAHHFGGLWTKLKLEVIGKYMVAYNTALKNLRVRRIYADAFAGTGAVDLKDDDLQGALIPLEEMQGSARIALEADFHEYHFNDLNADHVAALRDLEAQFPGKAVHVTQYDANEFIRRFCASLRRSDRAVLFVDPYSSQLQWESLEIIGSQDNIDLWLLFPISVLSRITPKRGANPAWEAKVSAMLGTEGWKDEIYISERHQGTGDLFGLEAPEFTIERLDMRGLQGYITNRLESIFPFTSAPLELRTSKAPIFLLYFAITNRSKAAQDLAGKIVNDILRKAGRR